MKLLAAMTIALVGCTEPYVHVIVSGTEPELLEQQYKVEVAAYTAEERTDFEYLTRLEPQKLGNQTDFVLTGELAAPTQLRVTIPVLTKTMFADAVLDENTGNELRISLSPGERPLGIPIAKFGGGADVARGADLATLYGGGIVIAWINEMGLHIRRDNDPDESGIGRPAVLEPGDLNVTSVRFASRTEKLNYDPQLYAVAWLTGAGIAKLRVTSGESDHPIRTIGLQPATDLRIAAAFEGTPHAVVAAVLTGSAIELSTYDNVGSTIATKLLDTGMPVDAVRGVAVTNDGKILLGWRGGGRSYLWRLDGTTLDSATAEKRELTDELLAMVLAPDDGKLYTFQVRSGNVLANVVFDTYNELKPSGVEAELGPMVSGGEIGVSRCLVSWPVRRSNALDSIDLRYAVLGSDGAPVGPSRILNVAEEFDHVRPSTLCASETRAFTVFMQQQQRDVPQGALKLRRIPSIQ